MDVMLIQTRFIGAANEVGISAYFDELPPDNKLVMSIKIDDTIQFVNRDMNEPTKSTTANFNGLEADKPYNVEFTILSDSNTISRVIPMYAHKCDYQRRSYFHKFSGGDFISKPPCVKGGEPRGDS